MSTVPHQGLEAHGIHAGYGGDDVVRDAALACPCGGVTGLIGPNGSGKSTLARVLAGVLPHRRGTVHLLGRDRTLWTPEAAARAAGYLPQQAFCAWPLRVDRLAALGRLPHLPPWGRPAPDDQAAVERALAATDMAALRARSVTALSGGEALRAQLARVLAGEPQVIIADEPLAGLDPAHQLQVMELFSTLARTEARAVLVVLHDLSMAARYCDRLCLLDRGRVVAEGAPRDVLTADHLRNIYGIEARIDWADGSPAILPLRRVSS